jgi:hypothetical protein
MALYRNGSAGSRYPELVDASVISLLEHISDKQKSHTGISDNEPSGWSLPVSQKTLNTYCEVETDKCFPFIVGGVGTNTGDGYRILLLLKAVRKAWVELAEGKLEADAFLAIANDVHVETETLAFPEKSNADILKKGIPAMIEMAEHSKTVFTAEDPLLPDGVPGCLRDNLLIDGQKLLAALVGSNLILALETIEANDDSIPQINCINDGYSWYIEAMKAKEIECVFSAQAESALLGIKSLIEAADRTNVLVQASTAAAEKIAIWRNL